MPTIHEAGCCRRRLNDAQIFNRKSATILISVLLSQTLQSTFLLLQGFLGAAAGAVGLAVTQSLAGSGLSAPSLPAVSVSAPKVSAPSKPAASAPKSKIAFVKEPKGECVKGVGL